METNLNLIFVLVASTACATAQERKTGGTVTAVLGGIAAVSGAAGAVAAGSMCSSQLETVNSVCEASVISSAVIGGVGLLTAIAGASVATKASRELEEERLRALHAECVRLCWPEPTRFCDRSLYTQCAQIDGTPAPQSERRSRSCEGTLFRCPDPQPAPRTPSVY